MFVIKFSFIATFCYLHYAFWSVSYVKLLHISYQLILSIMHIEIKDFLINVLSLINESSLNTNMFKPSIFDLKAQYLPKLFNCNNNGDFLNANISISLIGFF